MLQVQKNNQVRQMRNMTVPARFRVWWLLLAVAALSCQQEAPLADLILENGRVYTGEDARPRAECLAVRGDRILAVGSAGAMDVHRGPQTKVIDLNGMFACAGFNDAHMQQLHGNIGMMDVDLRGVKTPDEIRRRVYAAHRADPQPRDVWITGWGWDHSAMENNEWPDKSPLAYQRIWLERPMLFYRVCGHTALVNDKALKIAGITAETPDPPGGRIERNPETGEPTGILKERAIDLVLRFVPLPGREQLEKSMRSALQKMAASGITSVQGHGNAALYSVCRSLLDRGQLTCRMNFWSESIDTLRLMRSRHDSPMLTAGLLFQSLDGSMGTYNASMLREYPGRPHTRGIIKHSQDWINRLVLGADAQDIQVAIQAVGDNANHMALEAFELAGKMSRGRDRRYRIEHAQVLQASDLKRFPETGAVASMQPFHCVDDMRWIEMRIGQQQSRYAYAWRSLLDAGVTLAFGSYWPVGPVEPLLGIYAAVTRRDTSGFPVSGWHPEERISAEEALKAYTLGSAYAEYRDADKGTLKVGKLADIVVIDSDLLEISPDQILQAEVVYTFLGGKLVYARDRNPESYPGQ